MVSTRTSLLLALNCTAQSPGAHLHSLCGGLLDAEQFPVLGVQPLQMLLVLDLELVIVYNVQRVAELFLLRHALRLLRALALELRILELQLLGHRLLGPRPVVHVPADKDSVVGVSLHDLCWKSAAGAGPLRGTIHAFRDTRA